MKCYLADDADEFYLLLSSSQEYIAGGKDDNWKFHGINCGFKTVIFTVSIPRLK